MPGEGSVIGHRRPDNFSKKRGFKWADVHPGDYFKQKDGGWFLMSPTGDSGGVSSPRWTITEHDDGTITVAPSIWFDKPNGYHGFLERGVWRQA